VNSADGHRLRILLSRACEGLMASKHSNKTKYHNTVLVGVSNPGSKFFKLGPKLMASISAAPNAFNLRWLYLISQAVNIHTPAF
jgi:hypothetical protein